MPHLKLAVRGRMAFGQEWRNIFYWNSNSDAIPTTAQVQSWVNTQYGTVQAILHNGGSIYSVDAAVWEGLSDTDPKGWGAAHNLPVTMAFGAAVEAMPDQVAGVCVAYTGVKHVIGRKFVPCITETHQDGGLCDATLLAALQAFTDCWIGTVQFGAADYYPVTWGTRHGFTLIGSGRADQYLGTMRRRKPGVGI